MSKHSPDYVHASYLHFSIRLDEFKKKLVHAKRVLRTYKFDAIAIRGMSGALIGVPLAHALKKNILIVRKAGEKNHSQRGVEGDKATQRYIIADDLVDSGNTMSEMLRAIKTFAPQAICVGVLEWNDLTATTSCMMVPPEHHTDKTSMTWDEFGRAKEKTKPITEPERPYKSGWMFDPLKTSNAYFIYDEPKENTNAKVEQPQTATRSEAEVPTETALYSDFYSRGLQLFAESPESKARFLRPSVSLKELAERYKGLY